MPDLSLTKRHTLREAVLLYNLHSLTDAFAPRFSPTRFIPPVDPTQIIPRLDCFQGLGIKRYTLGVTEKRRATPRKFQEARTSPQG